MVGMIVFHFLVEFIMLILVYLKTCKTPFIHFDILQVVLSIRLFNYIYFLIDTYTIYFLKVKKLTYYN